MDTYHSSLLSTVSSSRTSQPTLLRNVLLPGLCSVTMEEEDYEVIRAARNASPHRFADWDRSDSFRRQYRERHANDKPAQLPNRQDGRSPSRASSAESVVLEEIGMARPQRHRMGSTATETLSSQPGLERHPTALSRIETHRSQHLGTVGSSLRARQSRQSKPLPNFGAGKDYPSPLPDREEYVVEFDGHDDPLHAQNWPMRRKCGTDPRCKHERSS